MKDDALLQLLGDRVRDLEADNYNLTIARNKLHEQVVQLTVDLALAKCDVAGERMLAERWQKLACRYDDIRGWLRLCTDDQVGHSEFYRECCLIIFGEYRGETEVDNDD